MSEQVQHVLSAVFRDGQDDASFETLSLSDLRADEVLVRIAAAGICHTDLTCRDGFMRLPRPIILGHEGAGVVERIGDDVKSVQVGDKVVLSFLACGACARCEAGEPSYCCQFMSSNLSGRRLDGSTALVGPDGPVSSHFFGQSSFASYSVANERNVIKVRDDAPLEMLGPLGCGIQTGAGSVMNVLRPLPGESLAVFGAGGVGLSAIMAAVIEGCAPIVAIEPNADRRALALQLGAHLALDPNDDVEIVERLLECSGGGVNNIVDTTGIPAVIEQAIGSIAQHGQLVLLSSVSMTATVTLPVMGLVGRGVRIYGVSMGDSVPKEFIPRLIGLFMEGRFPFDRMVKFYDFADINQALEDQAHGHAIKPILRMSGDFSHARQVVGNEDQ